MEDKTDVMKSILSVEEIKTIPTEIAEKLNKHVADALEEIITNKASNESLRNDLDEVRKKFDKQIFDLQNEVENYEVKIKNFNLSTTELRNQLNIITAERDNLLQQMSNSEIEVINIRKEKNNIIEERDSLLKVVERQNSELERFQEENKILQKQLSSAITAKCEALTRIDEIECKENLLEFKEKHMEQERSILNNQIQRLSEDLNRNITELQNIRGESSVKNMHLEAKFQEKLEELKIANSQSSYYKETIDSLTKTIQELNNKIYTQTKEANKMMEFYRKELDAKSKLAEIYKVNCDDTLSESNELGTAISDLKRMLAEASEQYGELETTLKSEKIKYEEMLLEKDKIIESQNSEILNANNLIKELKHENVESALSKLAPSAAEANRLIKSDVSLTELYSLYVQANEQNEQQKRENNRLNLQLKSILQELEDRAPILKKQELEFQKLVETKNLLTQEIEKMITKKANDQQELEASKSKISHLERENKKLRHSQSDLSRQICFLLKEVEQHRGGSLPSSNQTFIGHLITTDEVITKKLVTFKDITELQENNQKLLLLVRDLSVKLEESDVAKYEFSKQAYQDKTENFIKKINALQDSLQNQTKILNAYMIKCERYKKLYFEAFENSQQKFVVDEYADGQVLSNDFYKKARKDSKIKDKRIVELEEQLMEANKKIQMQIDQFDYYKKENKNNEKILNEQFDTMRTEVRELTSTNCKLISSVEYNKQQIKILHKNIATYKQQINALENRNKNYETTIIKHEQTILYLKDETIKSQKELSASEIETNYLRQENQMLKDSVGRLQSEKEVYQRAKHSQSLLLNNLEMIKASFERSEAEGRSRLEARLEEMSRELSAQRRRNQEEQDRFREITADLKRQTNRAKEQMEEEKMIAEKLREEIAILRDELGSKSRQINELSKKLQESLLPSDSENPISLANRRIKEMEFRIEELQLEKNSLCTELEKSREHSEQYFKMSQSAEKEIKNLHEIYSKLKCDSEKEITDLKKRETNLQLRIEELETEIQLKSLKEIQNDKEGSKPPQHIEKVQEELKDALQKLSETNRDLRAVRSELCSTSEILTAVEQKYANEMILHSADIQQITKLKEDFNKNREVMDNLKRDRDNAIQLLAQKENEYLQKENSLKTEKEELTRRLIDLDTQNSLLHSQIDSLSSKLSTFETSGQLTISANTSLNDGFDYTDTNKSLIEEENKSMEQLLQIIKFLRKEKEISAAKIDILKAENTRMMTEYNILQKKNDELNGFLNQERTKSETCIVTANRHEEILRKIETLNAVTDSNRILREERDSLAHRVKDLEEHISKIENELIPLQKQNCEMMTKIEEYCTEINSLKTEAMKWRQRANNLVEKSNKNPEEFKRLQSERENLAKMLTSEKDQFKKLSEELSSVKSEKTKLEIDVTSLSRQVLNHIEEKKKQFEDFTILKQMNTRLTQEVMEIKTKLLQKEELLQKQSEELESKEIQLQDSKSKEVQIRKIAKRYKDSFLELTSKNASTNNDGNSSNIPSQDGIEITLPVSGGVSNEGSAQIVETEKDLRCKIEILNNTIKTTQDEYEKLRKENEELKAPVEKYEKAKTKIITLTESNNAITQELATVKTKLQGYIQNSQDQDSVITGIKTQYEEMLTQVQKELTDQSNQSKEIITKLNRENESLVGRINQLSRQLGIQQTIKPSTSSGGVSDKSNSSDSCPPRTANVKPMSGSAIQQSATVTPWRGGDTPLASIRPISVQSSRTVAVLPTSQNNVVQGSSPSCNITNTALVPPQQVHTTGSGVESLVSSPTSTHIDFMPSTSSASVAVATIPPMGAVSAAESTQEAESVLSQNIEAQGVINIGQQSVALVLPRVEGSNFNISLNAQNQQETSNQPSTSGTTSFSHASVNVQSRHAPSSSNVTTTQASASHKRPRDIEGYRCTDIVDSEDKCKAKKKRTRMQPIIEQSTAVSPTVFSESGVDVEYQVPTSSQRDQEDDIIVVDSEDDGLVDEGNAEVDEPLEAENEGYEDSYEQNRDIDDNDCTDIDGCQFQVDNNEVEAAQSQNELVPCDTEKHENKLETNQLKNCSPNRRLSDAIEEPDNQQIQAISSGSGEIAANSFQQNASAKIEERRSDEGSAQIQDFSSGTIERMAKEKEMSIDRSHFEMPLAPKQSDSENQQDIVGVTASQETDKNETKDVVESETSGTTHSDTENCPSDGREIQENQIEGTIEDPEYIDGVSSEGEKTTIAEVEEEGREAEASTSPSVNTRSKAIRNNVTSRKLSRGCQRGGRPTPIIWQELNNQRNTEQPGSPTRIFQNQRTQRARRIRRPAGSSYGNMRYQ